MSLKISKVLKQLQKHCITQLVHQIIALHAFIINATKFLKEVFIYTRQKTTRTFHQFILEVEHFRESKVI